MSEVTDRLEHLSHRLRVAFAAGCANRVLRIYEYDYSEENRSPHAAVDVAWKFAAGEQIPEQTFINTLEAAEDATPNIEEEGDEYTGPASASVSAICALKAIEEPTARAAGQSASYALEAVSSFEDYAGDGEAAEKQWQERALKLVESWGDHPITRDMFAVLGDDPPIWFPPKD
jgi:hypothetical protein